MKVKIDREKFLLLKKHMIEINNGKVKRNFREGAVIDVEDGYIESFTRHPFGKLLSAGAFSHIVDCSAGFLKAKVGRYCSIARDVSAFYGHHPIHSVSSNPFHYSRYYSENMPDEYKYRGRVERFDQSYGRVNIENDVWIGTKAVIKGGVKISHGAVVCAASVVVKDVPPYAIVGGNPAKIIKYRFSEEIISRLLALEWWNIDPKKFVDLDMFDVEGFINELEARKGGDGWSVFSPPKIEIKNGNFIELL